MPRTVYVPELGRAFSFADGTSDEAVSAFFQKNFPAPPPSAAEVAPTPEAPVGPDESGIFGRFAYGFGTGLTNIPGGIASLFYPAEEAAQTTAGQFSEEARKYLEETLGIDPTKDPTAAQQAAQALGSVASFLVPGSAAAKGAALAGRTAAAAGRVGTATAAAQGVALGTEARAERIRDQLASGMEISEEDQLAAQRLSGLIGASEALPLGRFFGPISTLLSKVPVSKAPIVEQIVKSRLAKITKAGVAEGAQEVAAGIANDLVERGVYNPDVEIGQDLMSNFGTGAFAGSFVEGVIQLAAGRKLRPYRQLQEDLGREAAVNAQAQRQGEISRAAEELRKVNVEGDVEVIEDDFDGISRFTIRTPGGNTVGDFLDPAEAEEAVNIYKQRTDANVTVRKPADLPSVFPVKINGKEYQTTDEIIADRDSLVSKAEGLAAYMSRPDVIKREAARQNVSEALVKKATAEEVADLDKQIVKLNEFVAAAKPRPAEGIEAGDLRSQFAAPEAVVPEAIAPEAPIGAVEPVSVEAPITGAPAIAEPVEPSVAPTEPEKPRTSVGQLKEAPVRRRTLTQAEAEGPILRDYNQATIDRYASIYTALKSRLSGKVPKNAEVNLEELISTDKNLLVRGQARAVKTPNGIKSIVDLSTGILRPDMSVEAAVKELVGTLNHEIIHVLRDQGVIRPAEWNILSKAVVNTKVPGKKYTYMDKAQAIYTPYGQPITPVYTDPDAVIEEAVAEMYKDWVNNQTAPVQTRGLFNRITEFFRSIFRVLKSNKYEELFKAIDTGEVGAREGIGREGVARLSAGPTTNRAPGSPMSNDLNDREDKAFRLYPYLRTSAPRYYDHNRMILAGTNPGNAATQIANLDTLLARHPNTLASNEAFADYLADAMGAQATPETGVPMVPYGAVKFARNPALIANQLRRMTPGQLQMAEEGLSAAKDFEAAYRSGTATPVQTAKLILWGILSRGVSPFVQESMFLDVVKPVGISNRTGQMQGGIDQFINDAVNGEFDLESYQAYIKTLKLDGLPGAGTTHNLGAFGRTTLVKLQQRIPDGRTILQYLHDLISDYSLSGKEIRRRFHEVNPGIGINNKVLSFMMLVSGRDDVLVLDRVQMRNQYNDGRFNDYNLYDGETIEKEVQKKDGTTEIEDVADDGTGIAKMGDGVFGLMYYEALERDLMDPVRQAYAMIGRPNDFSMGRYHWESWVATSSQEVDHGSISGLIKEATGEADPYGGIYTGEGKYDTFNSGIKYGYTRDGQAYVALPDGLGDHYFFTPEFAKKVIKGYQKKSTRIIRDDTFKVSESTQGPWYDRPEVDKQALRQYLLAQTEVFKRERGGTVPKRVPQAGQADPSRPGPGPVHAIRRRGGVRQPPVTYPREGTVRFSAAPALNTEEFARWFRNSKVRNPDGTPKIVYHGTQGKFKAFETAQSELGAHFGTPDQANEFVQTPQSQMSREDWEEDVRFTGRSDQIFPVYLSMQNPLRMKDTGKWIPSAVAKRLHLEGLISLEQSKAISALPLNTPVQIKATQDLLKSRGIDGIVYLNRYEGFKPQTDPTQFSIDAKELSDADFKAKYPEAQDSYLIFDPVQVKSIFNEFEEGTATSPRFSAAPALNTEEFARWFRNSKVVNRDGTPKIQYHGTKAYDIFKSFKTTQSEMGAHFGTRGQAAEFVRSEPVDPDEDAFAVKDRVYPVYLSIQNPIRMTDLGHWSTSSVARRLADMGIITNGEAKKIESKPINSKDTITALQDILLLNGYDGIVYLNRREGIKVDPDDEGEFELSASDDEFSEKYPEAQDSYIIFRPEQVKSIFNQFEAGAAEETRFSAAPLPPYVEAKNRTLFVPERKESVFQSISDFFRGPTTMPKTLNTVYGQIDMKGGYFGTRANLYRRMSLVDQDAYIEFLEKTANEKDTGNFQRREATQSAIAALGWARRSSQLTAATVMQGPPVIEYSRPGDIQSATVAIRDDADKLIDIFRVMLEPGPVDPVTGEPRDKRVVFKSYATAKRAIGLKAAGKPVPRELDDVYINTTIQSVQRDYPEIVEAYEKYQRFNKKLITAARDAGRITDAELAKFTQQMDYYGFYRELYEEELVPGMPSKLAGDIKIREYKGSQRGELIEDPMLVILTNVNFWMGAITRNIAVNKSFKLAKDMGEARLLGASEKPDLSQGESEQVMFFRENGVQKRFAVKDPMLVISLGADDRINMGGAMNLLGVMPATVLRESITRDPVFMVRNLLRDTLSSWITSGEDITPFIGTVKGFRDALNNSTSFQALVGRGVVGSHDLAMRSPAEMAAIIRRRALPVNVMNVASIDGMQGLVMSAWDKLGVWSEASDAATRIAVYESAIKQGMSEAEAAFRAIEIMNFSRRGSNSFLQILTQIIPFLNARIQGMDVLYQAGKAGVMTATGYQLGERDANLGKKFLYRGAMLAALSVALEMMLDGDEDYEELPDYVKNGNLLIPLKWFGVEGGYFAAIPKPFEAGLLFSTIPQEMYKATTGQTSGREMAKFFWSEFTSTFGFNPIPQAMIPGLEALINYDFYTDLPLISEGKARLTPELQYDSRTSSVAMMLSGVPIKYNFTTGKFEGVSPIIIDQIISGYGGPMGSYLMQGVGLLMEGAGSVGIDIAPERLPRDITQLPAIKSFLLDAESRSPKSVAQAYELFRVVDEVNRSFSRLRQTGDVEATMDYLERNKDVLAYKKYIYKLFDGLNKISARERQIERDETMTREQKFEAMKQLREVRARLTSNIAEINKALGR